MRSVQKALRLQLLQYSPDQTEWKWSAAASTSVRSSVKIPASKLRLPSDFIPMPAPVRFAEPIYATSLEHRNFVVDTLQILFSVFGC